MRILILLLMVFSFQTYAGNDISKAAKAQQSINYMMWNGMKLEACKSDQVCQKEFDPVIDKCVEMNQKKWNGFVKNNMKSQKELESYINSVGGCIRTNPKFSDRFNKPKDETDLDEMFEFL